MKFKCSRTFRKNVHQVLEYTFVWVMLGVLLNYGLAGLFPTLLLYVFLFMLVEE